MMVYGERDTGERCRRRGDGERVRRRRRGDGEGVRRRRGLLSRSRSCSRSRTFTDPL